MDREGFIAYMNKRQFSQEVIAHHLSVVEGYEVFLQQKEMTLAGAPPEEVRAYAARLSSRGHQQYQDVLALLRYFYTTKNRPAYLTALNMLDGGEVMDNFYDRMGKVIGEARRDEIFRDLPLPTLGASPQERSEAMRLVMKRLESTVEPAERETLFASSLRDLPDEGYAGQKKMYEESGSIDEYLVKQGKAFIEQLTGIMQRGELFFNQEITEEVIRYVEVNPEILHGVRQGNIVYHTKIPYMAKEYLAETDETLKRYYGCHCPWARESILTGRTVSPAFCQCSAGFEKKPWEVIFGQHLEVDVLQTVLKGDRICRFAVHLPEDKVR